MAFVLSPAPYAKTSRKSLIHQESGNRQTDFGPSVDPAVGCESAPALLGLCQEPQENNDLDKSPQTRKPMSKPRSPAEKFQHLTGVNNSKMDMLERIEEQFDFTRVTPSPR